MRYLQLFIVLCLGIGLPLFCGIPAATLTGENSIRDSRPNSVDPLNWIKRNSLNRSYFNAIDTPAQSASAIGSHTPERLGEAFLEELPRRSLQAIEDSLGNSPDELITAARLEESLSRLEQQEAQTGLRLLGRGNIGNFQELAGPDDTRQYNKLVLAGGLRYPLLGRYEQNKLSVLDAEAQTWEARLSHRQSSLEALASVRAHYINLWSARRENQTQSHFFRQGRWGTPFFREPHPQRTPAGCRPTGISHRVFCGKAQYRCPAKHLWAFL